MSLVVLFPESFAPSANYHVGGRGEELELFTSLQVKTAKVIPRRRSVITSVGRNPMSMASRELLCVLQFCGTANIRRQVIKDRSRVLRRLLGTPTPELVLSL